MQLRPLALCDAPLILEWMHDSSVVGHMGTNFMEKTLTDCEKFILWSQTATQDLHLAVVDEKDEYQGTVSLKHIEKGMAEFAITIRACAMGKGVSAYAMESILRKGLDELGLDKIYWCVSPENQRAVRFYDKHSYPRVDVGTLHPVGYSQEQLEAYIWYAVTKADIARL